MSLERFIDAQRTTYDGALAELRRGRKTGHWIWFVLPQVRGLGTSPTSQTYGVQDLDEARAYLAHPVLGPRLHECAQALLDLPEGTSAREVLGGTDAMKVRSSMTLFLRADPTDPVFQKVLDRFYGGEPDDWTDDKL